MGLLCRKITASDLDKVVILLHRGFPVRTQQYWKDGLEKLSARSLSPDFPRYGFLLEENATIVGVILTIFSEVRTASDPYYRCNVSSWHVVDRLKSYASMMISAALARKDVTYVNVSPAPHTRPIIEAQGFKRYCDGQIISVPALAKPVRGASIRRFTGSAQDLSSVSDAEAQMMTDHVRNGCVGILCESNASCVPFIFVPRTLFRGRIGGFHLGYCRRLDNFVAYAGPIGRWLTRYRKPLVVVDANQPISSLPGRYFADLGPKYFRGSVKPELGDLTYTEGVFFH